MWSSLVFLSLAVSQISAQGFQLFFGTTAAVTECKDKLPNCFAFGKDSCKAPYEKWAQDYCPNFCGYCQGPTTPAPPCENLMDNCEAYQKTVCTDTKYRQWAYDNCRYYCRLCTPDQLIEKDSHITTIPPALCVDKLDDCKLYGQESCKGQYANWAKENCRRYCGFCVGLPTPAPPCRDKIPNCQQYQKDTCNNEKYKGWAEDNCNKYCGFCTDGSSTGTPLVPVTAGPLIPQLTGVPPMIGTMAPPLPGKKRNLGAGSSANIGQSVMFETQKPKVTPKPTPQPTTAAPTTMPPTTTPKPTTTPQPTTAAPKPKDNAVGVGSSASGNKDKNVIDFPNESGLPTTEAPQSGTTKNGSASGTGSSAGGGTTAPPSGGQNTEAPVTTKGPTKAPTTQASGVTSGPGTDTSTKKTDAGTGSQPGGGSTEAPSGTTSGSGMGGSTSGGGMGGSTAGSGMGGSTSGSGSVTTAATGTGGTGGNGNGTDAGTGSGPNSGSLTVDIDLNKTDIYTDYNNTDKVCRDLVNCRVYPAEKICTNGSIYQPWASVRCRAYCGFCIMDTSPVPCVDKIPNCNEYDADLCTNPLYRLFREDNCAKFCSLCKDGTGRRDSEDVDGVIFY